MGFRISHHHRPSVVGLIDCDHSCVMMHGGKLTINDTIIIIIFYSMVSDVVGFKDDAHLVWSLSEACQG